VIHCMRYIEWIQWYTIHIPLHLVRFKSAWYKIGSKLRPWCMALDILKRIPYNIFHCIYSQIQISHIYIWEKNVFSELGRFLIIVNEKNVWHSFIPLNNSPNHTQNSNIHWGNINVNLCNVYSVRRLNHDIE